MLRIFDVEVPAVERRGVLHPLFLLLPAWWAEAAIHDLIRPGMRRKIALGIDRRSGLQDQYFKAAGSQLLGSHATGRARADDQCVVSLCRCQRYSPRNKFELEC